jgi:drug/metabolite transporter (DMT)-like permease
MLGPTVLALAAMCCFGIGDFIYKRSASAGIKPIHFITTQTVVFALLTLLYAWVTNTIVIIPGALWNGLAGLLMMISFLHFFKSLANGPISINAPIFRLNFIITAVLAIMVLHEPLTALKVVAVCFAFAAIWLLLGSRNPSTRMQGISQRSLIDVTVATTALGAANFCHKVGVSSGVLPETGMLASATVFTTLAILTTIIEDRKFAVPYTAWKHSAPAALASVCAFLFLLHALAIGQASVLVPIAQMGSMVSVGLGVLFLGETMTPRKFGGLAAAIAALALLAAS